MDGLFKAMTHIAVVIPVFNESEIVEELLNQVTQNVTKITDDFEILVIDDGSEDSTWKKLSIIAQRDKRVKAIQFSRNFGQHFAITAGLNQVKSDWVIVMDGDLQDRPEVIPSLYEKAMQGFDIVFVSRQNRPESLFYRIIQKIFYIFLNLLSGLNLDSRQANFSILNRKVVEAFNLFPEYGRFYGSTIKWLGFTRSQIFANHGKRYAGSPSYTFKKRIKLATDIIIAFSERPLKGAIVLGALLSLISIFGGIFIGIRALTSGFSVIGWASLMVTILLVSGIILVVLGILGIYIGRIFQEVKSRPLYITKNKLNMKSSFSQNN